MVLFVNPLLHETARAALLAGLPTEIEAVFRADLPEGEQALALQRAELLLGNPPAAWLKGPLKLRWWQLESAGFDGYRDANVTCPVTNVGDYYAWPCAETMVAGLLALYRRLPELAVLQTRSEWVGQPLRLGMQLLRGKRVIILGAGTIGKVIRQLLSGFECQTRLMARTSPEAELHSVEELKDALPTTDVVISTLPGSAKNFYSAELIDAMQPGSVFANVGRGSTVDEPALIAALERGHLGGAVLDVTAAEPLPADSPLWTLPNVVLTQHTGGGQPDEDGAKVAIFLDNLRRFLAGEELANQVELGRGY